MSYKLNNCYRCGGNVRIVNMSSGRYYIRCDDCKIRFGETWGNNGTPKELLNSWNSPPNKEQVEHFGATYKKAEPKDQEDQK